MLKRLGLALPAPALWLVSMALPALFISDSCGGSTVQGHEAAFFSVEVFVVSQGTEFEAYAPYVRTAFLGLTVLVLAGIAFAFRRRYWAAALLGALGLLAAAVSVYFMPRDGSFFSALVGVYLFFFTGSLPNILILEGSAAAFFSWYRAAAICGGMALLGAIGAGVWIAPGESHLLLGYWVWTASFLVLLLAALWEVSPGFPERMLRRVKKPTTAVEEGGPITRP
ncbi:MAG: hypothetical protein HYU30_05555 [Chloroflexi bacterium]|nr:hypothetical protein [Chloroflexota bacterium]MBI4198669.1 hypothetical protein [Chloroflexota bacterium]